MSAPEIPNYRILEKIGEGGMGEVYRAEDTRLGRQVAIKVLPDHLASDPERMARLQREARVLASLEHPRIASIYGIEDTRAGGRALILGLVEGPTLADRLSGGALSIDDAVVIARQIAEALEAAHESDVVHRDLKPANVKVSDDLEVVVLDFGLAKALAGRTAASVDDSASPTLSHQATQAGVLLGTASYMSPEQARGRSVDKRADIWAFGCVLFEMLTGRRLFRGETVSDTLADVLRADIPWDALPARTPRGLRRLLERCLERDPKERLRDIGEARIAIDQLSTDAAPADATLEPAPSDTGPSRALFIAAGFVIGALAAWGLFAAIPPDGSDRPVRKYELAMEGLEARRDVAPQLSPDGSRIVYAAEGRLWIRSFDELVPREIPGSEGGSYPFWAADSSAIGFFASRQLLRAPVDGGPAVLVLDLRQDAVPGAGAAWGLDGEIVYAYGNQDLFAVSARGGEERVLLAREDDEGHFHGPGLLPGGRGLVFVVHGRSSADTLALLSDAGKQEILKLEGQTLSQPVYTSGHILFYREPATPGIWALPFSLSELEPTGEPFLVAPNANFPSASIDGSLAYVGGVEVRQRQLVWLNRQGEVVAHVGTPSSGLGAIGFPGLSLSPDRSRALVTETEGGSDLWVYELERGTRTRATFTPAEPEDQPAWGPDNRIAFTVGISESDRQIFMIDPGSAEARHVVRGSRPAFTPDGEYLLYSALTNPDDIHTLWRLGLDGQSEPEALATSEAGIFASISPDGQWIAYTSTAPGRREVLVSAFPSGEGRRQVTTDAGNHPRWGPNGDRLFYLRGQYNVMEVSIENQGGELSIGQPELLFSTESLGIEPGRGYGYDPEQDRFLMVQSTTPGRSPTITFIENGALELAEPR